MTNIYHLLFVFLGLLSGSISYAQTAITGKVIDHVTGEIIGGATVAEKGTDNMTMVGTDGIFKLNIHNSNAVLVISYITYLTQEYPLNGRTNVSIELKPVCRKEFFDNNLIAFHITSGIVNTPIGGRFEISKYIKPIPGIFKFSVEGGSDLVNTSVLNTQLALNHFITTCDFDIDLNLSYRHLYFANNFNSRIYGIESRLNDLPIHKLSLITGLNHLTYKTALNGAIDDGLAPVIGIAKSFDRLWMSMETKLSIYKYRHEFQARANKHLGRQLRSFINFYKLQNFNELTIGLGYEFSYRKNRRLVN